VISRRALLGSLAGGLLAAPLAARAQQAGKVFCIGVLYPGADNSIFRNNFNGFRQVLGPAGMWKAEISHWTYESATVARERPSRPNS